MSLLSLRNSLHGALIYSAGDSFAAYLTNEFQIVRMLGMMTLGGTLYAVEIPAYFAWIERRIKASSLRARITRAVLAQAFFNPLWIARHMALIACFSGRFSAIDWPLLKTGVDAFIGIVPVALCVNYSIQNLIPLRWRFLVSALFSAGMACYYALSEVLFVSSN